MTEIDDLANEIANLKTQVETLTRTSGIANTSLSEAGETTALSDTVVAAQESADTLPGLQELLDANEAAIAANKEAVDAAVAAATQAGLDGIAAGELAATAADEALSRAQQALDAAATAGGDSVYTGRAPTAEDPGSPGRQWFVWDTNYTVTARYVFDGDSSTWVQAELANQVIDNLDAGVITSGYLSSGRIAAGSIFAGQIAADTLTSREIGADAILARNIKAGQVTATAIAASTITGDKIAANTITAGNIAAGSITANEIAAGTITATQINLDSLSGKTITGATIRTAASGARVEFSNVGAGGGVGNISFYSGGGNPTAIQPADAASQAVYIGSPSILDGVNLGSVVLRAGTWIIPDGQSPSMSRNVKLSTSDIEAYQSVSTPTVFDSTNGRILINDTGWSDVPVVGTNGFSADPTLGLRWRRMGQYVEVSGQINRSSSITAGMNMAQLPAGSRPARPRYFLVPGSGTTYARIAVGADGWLNASIVNGTTSYLIVDAIKFLIN